MKLPDSLSRNAVIRIFDEISAVAWEKLFEREVTNGIAKLRVPGDFTSRTYYSTEGLIHWLVRNNRYTPNQIDKKFHGTSKPAMPAPRVHLMAG